MIAINNLSVITEILAQANQKRKAYVILYHRDYANRLNVETVGIDMVSDRFALITDTRKPIIRITTDYIPSADFLQLVDEFVTDAGKDLADIEFATESTRDFMLKRFKVMRVNDKNVWYQRMLDPKKFKCYQVNKHTKPLLETITDWQWEPWHKVHYWPESQLLLQVIWDRREIVNAKVLDNDSAEVLQHSQPDDDLLIRYCTYEHLTETLEPISDQIDFVQFNNFKNIPTEDETKK